MIKAYHRPRTIEEALELISRATPRTLPLGGGTLLSHGPSEDVEVVDLQALGLNRIEKRGNRLEVGATTTLQQLMEHTDCPDAIIHAIRLEAPVNIRNAATVAGTLVACDGRSAFATALLALDANLMLVGQQPEHVPVGEFLAMRKAAGQAYLIRSCVPHPSGQADRGSCARQMEIGTHASGGRWLWPLPAACHGRHRVGRRGGSCPQRLPRGQRPVGISCLSNGCGGYTMPSVP